MGQIAVSTMLLMMVVAVLESTSAWPVRYYKSLRIPPVNLNIHPPVTGAQLALARGQALQPFLHQGFLPVDDYYSDDVLLQRNPGFARRQSINKQVVVLNNPELDNVNIGGGNFGSDFY